MLNTQLILDRISEINTSLERLEKIGDNELNNFLENHDSQDIASYRLLIVIESCISICQHLTAKLLKKSPESYANCFEMLADHEIISKDLSLKLQNMARFRNMLVHIYWNIDYKQVYAIIKT